MADKRIPIGGELHSISGGILADAKEIRTGLTNSDTLAKKLEGIDSSIGNKVDKTPGKQLSTEDYTTAEKEKLAVLENFNPSGLEEQIGNKVDKAPGKQLSTEDYTTVEKEKLAGLENFDPSEINAELSSIRDDLNSIISAGISLSFSPSPWLIFEGVNTKVTLTAKIKGATGNIEIKKGGSSLGKISDRDVLTVTDTVTTGTTWTATALAKGKSMEATTKVTSTRPMYVGPGKVWSDVGGVEEFKVKTPKTSPTNTDPGYKVTITEPGQKVYIIIPDSMTDIDLKKVTLEGFLFPMSKLGNQEITGSQYKVYESGPIDEPIVLNIKVG